MKRAWQLLLVLAISLDALAEDRNGRDLVEASLQQHAPPAYLYEEQAWVLMDPLGRHSVRTARRYARRDANGSQTLLEIETPAESRGSAVVIERDFRNAKRRGTMASSTVFGSNFRVADIDDEQMRDFRYERESDHDLDRIPHYVVRALPLDAVVTRETGYHERRIYLRKDNLYISRIDFKDRDGHLAKRLSFRDPRPDETGAWRANMMLMEDLRDGRRTLLKLQRLVHSPDYVPASIFAGLPGQP